jgi:hypothetical protein
VGRIEVENARFVGLAGRQVSFEVPTPTLNDFALLARRLYDKHNGYCQLTVGSPHVPKSTGPGSLNNHSLGHARQIAAEIGDSPEGVLREAMLQTPEYPSTMGKLGHLVPQRWSLASKTEAMAVIETLHRFAAFIPMTLKEE